MEIIEKLILKKQLLLCLIYVFAFRKNWIWTLVNTIEARVDINDKIT